MEADSGGTFLRNGKFLRLLTEQANDTPDSQEDTEKVDYKEKADDTLQSRVHNTQGSNVNSEEGSSDNEVQGTHASKQKVNRRSTRLRVQFSDKIRIIKTRHVQDPSCASPPPQARRCG